MAETVVCTGEEECNCICNCQAFLTGNRRITVNPLEINENHYTFGYTITNWDSSINSMVFCVDCSKSTLELSSANTSILITGNPNDTPVIFTECFVPGCETGTENSFYVSFNSDSCCRAQGIKIDINSAVNINEILFSLTFTLPNGLKFNFHSGNLKLSNSQVMEIVDNLCMPGCGNRFNMNNNICRLWQIEKNILDSNKDTFIKFTQLLLPPTLDLSTLSILELENLVRAIIKLQNCSANVLCEVAKALETKEDYTPCTCCKMI